MRHAQIFVNLSTLKTNVCTYDPTDIYSMMIYNTYDTFADCVTAITMKIEEGVILPSINITFYREKE